MAKHYFKVQKTKPSVARSLLSVIFSNFSIVNWLIVVNILFFILAFLCSIVFGAETVYSYLAIQANNLFDNRYFWTLLTSMFLHAGFIHLFVNMLSLYFIGSFLEMIIGKKRFFWLYLLSGIFAGLFFAVLSYYFGSSIVGRGIFSDPHTFAVGASGAIFAIAGVLAILTPKNKVYLIAGPLIAIIIESILWIFIKNPTIISIIDFIINAYIILAIFSMLSFSYRFRKLSLPIEMPFWMIPIAAIVPLIIIGLYVELPIGNMAHLGGFIFGALYGCYLRLKYKKKTKMLSEHFS